MKIAVNISNQNIKIVAAEKRRIIRWETVELPPGLVKDGRILKPEETARVLRGVFENTGLPQTEITASLTGMSFIYRLLVLPELKTTEIPEAVERAIQKEINVSLEDLYLDWQVVAQKNHRLEIFVIGSPRTLVDSLVQVFKMAGLTLTSLDINSLALARLANRSRALIANFEVDWFDIVIVADGLPVTLHSVAPKGSYRELEDSYSQLNDEIRRSVDFFNLTHKESNLQPDEPVIISGVNSLDENARKLAEKFLPDHSPASPDGRLVIPASFIPSDYAVLLGMLLRDLPQPTNVRRGVPGYQDVLVNLLAARRRSLKPPFSWKSLVVPGAIVLAVLLLTPLLMLRNSAVSENRAIQSRLDLANRELNLRRALLAQADIDQAQIDKLVNDTLRIRQERTMISGGGDLNMLISLIISGFSDKMEYQNITSSSTQIIIEGQAAGRQDVLNFTGYLENLKKFAEVRIGAIEDIAAAGSGSAGPPAVLFRVVLERKSGQ